MATLHCTINVYTPAWTYAVADAAYAADSPETQRLQERIRVLEERLDRLDRADVIKKTVEYICPGGEIFDEAPPGGRCPDGSRPQLRDTFQQSSVARRESIGEKIEAALQDVDAKKVAIHGSARGAVQQVANGKEGQNQLSVRGQSISRCCTIQWCGRPVHRF